MGGLAAQDRIAGQTGRDLKRAREATVLVMMRDGKVQPLALAYAEMRRLMRKAKLRLDANLGETVPALDKDGKPMEIDESAAREMRAVLFDLLGYTAPKLLAAKIDGPGFEPGGGGGARTFFVLPPPPMAKVAPPTMSSEEFERMTGRRIIDGSSVRVESAPVAKKKGNGKAGEPEVRMPPPPMAKGKPSG